MSSSQVAWLNTADPPEAFPSVDRALREPDGLLAAGGNLSEERLLFAYRNGIFPWYEEGQPILWWSPDPRCILVPGEFHVSRRLRQYARRSTLTLSFNREFAAVIAACAGARDSQQGTWITADINRAFLDLHDNGWAHSVEIWDEAELVGGLYGMSIGRVFFGESMFSHRDNASKFALLGLCSVLARHDFSLLDCQVLSQHLLTLGARKMDRGDFIAALGEHCADLRRFADWPEDAANIGDFLPN